MIAAFLFRAEVFWPYLAGVVFLLIGAATLLRRPAPRAQGVERVLALGPLFLAVPMAVFGADHFVAPAAIARIVPAWMPWHLFWAYFVGTALFAAALSILTRKHASLAAALLALMLFSFVLLIHVPNLLAEPGDRFALAILLRDLSFSTGALVLSTAGYRESRPASACWTMIFARFSIAVTTLVFGLEHFLHPGFVPVVPLRQPMPAWMPAGTALGYASGAVMLVCGAALIAGWRARAAATWLGVFVAAIVLLVYLPILIANAADIAKGLNYFADTLTFSGSVLLVAEGLPREEELPAGVWSHWMARGSR